MSGDGGGAPQPTQLTTPAQPAPAGQVNMANFQPFFPGQQEMLAQQMAQGFGGSPQAYVEYMNGYHRPMQVPILNRPSDVEAYLAQLAATSPSSSTASSAKKGDGLLRGLSVTPMRGEE